MSSVLLYLKLSVAASKYISLTIYKEIGILVMHQFGRGWQSNKTDSGNRGFRAEWFKTSHGKKDLCLKTVVTKLLGRQTLNCSGNGTFFSNIASSSWLMHSH